MVRKKVHPVSTPRPQTPFTPGWVASLLVALLVGLFAGYHWGYTNASQQQAAAATPPPSEANAAPANNDPQRFEVSADDDPARGPEDAPVVIIEFSDYQCPFCRRFRQQTFDRLFETYGDQIRFVYRDFPLTQIHPEAVNAAIAANCAGEQGKYWAYHDKLFEQAQGLGHEAYLAYAKELGLDMEAFQACLQDPAQEKEVLADRDYGAQLGVTGTPTFSSTGSRWWGPSPSKCFSRSSTRSCRTSPEGRPHQRAGNDPLSPTNNYPPGGSRLSGGLRLPLRGG